MPEVKFSLAKERFGLDHGLALTTGQGEQLVIFVECNLAA